MEQILIVWSELTLPPLIVGGFVLFLGFIFFLLYFLPAMKLLRHLGAARRALIPLSNATGVVEKHLVEKALQHNPALLHAWKEYAHTLHAQYQSIEGEERLRSLRATAPAEMFFSPASIVDTALRTEFFKHLPGILTGVGIIGTFCGLIVGLQSFKVGADPEVLGQHLALLLKSVWEAFLASGFAISAAILVTLVEKSLFHRCYSSLEGLVQTLDSFYEAGAGEEYLASLVKSAEESATQTKHLKEALVNDLKSLLDNYSASLGQVFRESLSNHSRELVQAQSASQKELSSAVTEAIGNSLAEPMRAISTATKTLGGDQSQAVGDLLSAVLGKLETTFGGQIGNLNGLMEQNAATMKNLQNGFNDLLENLKQASETTNVSLGNHLQQIMTEMDSRQERMNGSILSLMEKISATAETERGRSEKHLTETLTNFSGTVERLMNDLATQRQALGEAGQQGLAELQQGLGDLIEEVRNATRNAGSAYEAELKRLLESAGERQRELGGEVRALVEEMRNQQATQQHETAERLNQALASITTMIKNAGDAGIQREEVRAQSDAERATRLDQAVYQTLGHFVEQSNTLADTVKQGVASMAATVANLEKVTVNGAASLNDAAEQLLNTAVEFEKAGKQVVSTLERASKVQESVASTAQSLETASHPMQEALQGYKQQQEQLAEFIDKLRNLIDDADARAGVSRELLNDMQNMVNQAGTLHTEANQYLAKVNDVLQLGFNSFADAVIKNMEKSRAAFDTGLSDAVKMISSQVQELEATLDKLIRAAGRQG